MKINIELSGGLELLFEKKTHFEIEVPENTNLKELIQILKKDYLKEKPDLFVQGETVYVHTRSCHFIIFTPM